MISADADNATGTAAHCRFASMPYVVRPRRRIPMSTRDGGISTSLPGRHIRATSQIACHSAHDGRRRGTPLTWTSSGSRVSRDQTQHHVRTSFDEATQSMLARNYFDEQFADYVAFASISEKVAYYTADRREFLGRNGTISSPAALERAGLSGAIGATIDPCCALQVMLTLEPGETGGVMLLAPARRRRSPGQCSIDARAGVAVEGWRRT